MPGGSAERVGAGGGAPAPIPPGMGVLREGIANSLAPGPSVVVAADTVLAAAASSRPALPAAPLPQCGRAGRGSGGGARRRFSPALPCPLARSLAAFLGEVVGWLGAYKGNGEVSSPLLPDPCLEPGSGFPGNPGAGCNREWVYSGSKGEGAA